MRRLAAAVALATLCVWPYAAFSEPVQADAGVSDGGSSDVSLSSVYGVLHFPTDAYILTGSGNRYAVTPGYYLPERDWQKLDTTVRELQASQTRLTAENASLRATNQQHAWTAIKTVLYSVGVGVVLGAVGFWYVTK